MNVLLVTQLVVVWAAVVLRVDLYPLTWAPMYSVLRPGDTIAAGVVPDENWILATRRDGSTERLSSQTLNVPKWSLWRLTHERMLGTGPNKFIHANADGERVYAANWEWRTIRAVNMTLERAEQADSFIVRLEHESTFVHFDKSNINHWWTQDEHASLLWREEWSLGDEPI